MDPKVTFVIPCYNLAHFLVPCVQSILAQTYRDFEVLIMDDASSDDTPEVARSFRDTRVQYIRNEANLGHLQNYNKGITAASGEYVWLISPDDFLRRPYVLERYVEILTAHPGVGYVFCPGMKFQENRETELVPWSAHGSEDQIFNGRQFLGKLLRANGVCAPTGLVSKACYDKIGMFPLDLPNSGDWYLWCELALHYDVAYLAEPMVCYRVHGANMSEGLKKKNPRIISDDNIRVRWMIMKHARSAGQLTVVAQCREAIATYYAILIANDLYENDLYRMTVRECEESIDRFAADEDEKLDTRARIYVALGDQCYLRYDFWRAKQFYRQGLREQPHAIGTWIKYALTRMGRAGMGIRRCAAGLRRDLCRVASGS